MVATNGEGPRHGNWLADFGGSLAVWRKVLGVAGAAFCHDLNNPLQGVVGFADLLLQTAGSEELRKDLEVVLEGGLACRRLADEFGDLAEMFQPEAEQVDLERLSRPVLLSVLPENKWRIDISGQTGMLLVDPVYMALVLRGLCAMADREGAGGRLVAAPGPSHDDLDLLCEVVCAGGVSGGSGPRDLDYWLGRRAARLLGGGMQRSIEDNRVVTRAWLPGVVK